MIPKINRCTNEFSTHDSKNHDFVDVALKRSQLLIDYLSPLVDDFTLRLKIYDISRVTSKDE